MVQDYEELVYDTSCVHGSLARIQSALDQFETDKKQLREILDQVQRDHEQSSAVLTQVRGQINRFGSINSVDRRLQKVENNLSQLYDQDERLTKLHLLGTSTLLQPPNTRERDPDTD
uniref:Uncharacterized protein n=1 Tax=Peronospora matthiolae TaxID=2874970 RepID=A0AAV1V9A5_9STRA